jgi:hypothetical protein
MMQRMRDTRSLRAVRRLVVLMVCSVLLLGACSSGKKKTTPTTTTPVSSSASSTTTGAATSTTSRPATSTSRATTTTAACPNSGPTGAQTTPASQVAAVLTGVAVASSGCGDQVLFQYKVRGVAPPSCKIEYRTGPFVQDASGAPVTIAGYAFVVVRCFPAYTYAPETGATTFAEKRIHPAGMRHVRELVKTGDNEGVLTWVIGLDSRRPFTIAAKGTPKKELAVNFS